MGDGCSPEGGDCFEKRNMKLTCDCTFIHETVLSELGRFYALVANEQCDVAVYR